MATYSLLLFTRHLQPTASSPDYDPMALFYIKGALDVSNFHNLAAVCPQIKVDGGSLVERAPYGILVRPRKFKATKPQDRVYGIRGLMPELLLASFPQTIRSPLNNCFKMLFNTC